MRPGTGLTKPSAFFAAMTWADRPDPSPRKSVAPAVDHRRTTRTGVQRRRPACWSRLAGRRGEAESSPNRRCRSAPTVIAEQVPGTLCAETTVPVTCRQVAARRATWPVSLSGASLIRSIVSVQGPDTSRSNLVAATEQLAGHPEGDWAKPE